MTPRTERLPEIDWLKGFAILSVLFIHTRLFDGHLLFTHVVNRAVGIFLVLFGVTSELWWSGEAQSGAGFAARLRDWYGRRLTRLLIVVWSSLGLWWAAVVRFRLPGAQLFDWPHVLASALGYSPWVGTTWFVTLVLQLVVLFPLLRMLLPARAAWLGLAFSSALCVACVLRQWDVMALGRRLFGGGLGVAAPGWLFAWMFAPRVFWHVLGGAYVARRWGGRPPPRVTAAAVVLALLGVPLAAFLRASSADPLTNNLRESALFHLLDVPLTIALLAAFRRAALPGALRSWLAFCGRASWGIYLGHVLVDELIHLTRVTPRGDGEGAHAVHMLVLLCGATGLVLLGNALRDGARALLARVRWRAVPAERARDGLLIARGLCLLACTGALLALSALALREWFPAFDNALIWLRTMDVGGPYTPLVGVYSRFGWTHPGPAIYYALAPSLRLLGARPTGLLVGVVLIALAAAIVLVLRVAARAGASAALVCAVAACVLAAGMREHFIDPWNPFLLVFPFALFVAAIWLWSDGDETSLPIAALAASFAAQLHVGVIPVILALSATAFALRVRWRPATSVPGEMRRALVVTGFVLVGLWAPPLIAEITAPASNLLRIAQFFLANKNGDEVVGLGRGLGIAAAELAPWGALIGHQRLGMMADVLPAPIWQLAVPLGSIALAAWIGVRRGDRLVVRLAIVLAVAVLACIFSYAHIRGLALGYLAVWTRVIAMFCLAAPLIALTRV